MALRKSQLILDKMEKNHLLSPSGKDWLIQAVDPFHDLPIRPTGLPDTNSTASVIQCVKLQATITCPVGITSGNWDCHISNTPWWVEEPGSGPYGNPGRNGINFGAAFAPNAYQVAGGLSISSAPAGQSTLFGVPSGDPASTLGTCQTLSLPTTYFDGPSRVISAGFEVYNTTAEIYKQGGVTCYRMEQPVGGDYTAPLYLNGGTATAALQNVVSIRPRKDRPGTIANAQLLTGSRSWKAEEGAYCVLAMNDVYVPETLAVPIVYDIVSDDYNSHKLFGLTQSATSPNLPSVQPVYLNQAKFSTTGAYFTGLSLQTTLNVFFNVYVERFPLPSQNPDLVVLAQPSPQYDPVALELYSRIMNDMPVGVPVRENGLGQWFVDAVSNIAPIVGDALSSIPHPFAQVASQGARMAGKMAAKYATPGPSLSERTAERVKAKKKKAKAKALAAKS